MHASLFRREDLSTGSKNLVMYLHSRAGSRLEGRFLVENMCPKYSVLLFDFSGLGNSEGGIITLGPQESFDAFRVLNEVRTFFNFEKVFVWGVEMGAVAGILLGEGQPEFPWAGFVFDSPYDNFDNFLTQVLLDSYDIPETFVVLSKRRIFSAIGETTGFGLESIDIKAAASKIKAPVFLMVGKSSAPEAFESVKILFSEITSDTKELHFISDEAYVKGFRQVGLAGLYFMLKCMEDSPDKELEKVKVSIQAKRAK